MSTTITATTTASAGEAITTTLKPAPITASFNYYSSPTPPSTTEISAIFGGTSSKLSSQTCPVHDIRATLSTYTLSHHGFQILQHSSQHLPPQSPAIPDFQNDTFIQKTYWPELTALLKTQLGVRSAIAINTTHRDLRVVDKIQARDINALNPRAANVPFAGFFVVHGDYSPAGGRAHLRAMAPGFFEENKSLEPTTTAEERAEFLGLRDEIMHAEEEGMQDEGLLPDDRELSAEEKTEASWKWTGANYKGPRWAILSVWRPLEVVEKDPLGLMDARGFFFGEDSQIGGRASSDKMRVEVKEKEKGRWVGYDRNYKARPGFVPEYRSENVLPLPPTSTSHTANGETPAEEQHNWFYISSQNPSEVIALKLFDSEAHLADVEQTREVVPFAPHSAFALPNQEGRSGRRSVEVRVFVVW